MAKLLRTSNHCAKQIEGLQDSNEFGYGVLIGQLANENVSKFLIVHLARTPPEEAEDVDGSSTPPAVEKPEDIESEWFKEHVKQVRAMLPGGQDIQGMFIVSSTANLIGNPKAKSKIFECSKVIQSVRETESSTPLAFLQIDCKSQSVKAEQILVSDQNKTKTLTFETGDLNWLCLTANLILDLPLAFTQEQTERPLSQKLDTAVKRLSSSLESSVFLINGQFLEKDQILNPKATETSKLAKESGKKKGKKTHQRDDTTTTATEDEDDSFGLRKKSRDFSVDILFDEDSSYDCLVADTSAKMNIMGRMSVRAYVHERATFETAAKSIKEDIIRTFKARMDMHFDSLVGEEMGHANLPILHEPPRRVNIYLPDNSITVSDLLFPGETPEESVKAVEEMLGFTPQFEQLDDELEIVASPQTVRMEDGESRAESPVLEKKASESNCSTFQIILSIIVVLMAIGGSYYLTMTNDNQEYEENFSSESVEEDDAQIPV